MWKGKGRERKVEREREGICVRGMETEAGGETVRDSGGGRGRERNIRVLRREREREGERERKIEREARRKSDREG